MGLFIWICCSFKFMLTTMMIIVTDMGFFEIYILSYSCNVAGVSNCYVFKSRLQEFAQKVGLSTPVYETTKEGPSHEPTFRSTVIVSNERYDSLPGFFNRKAAEQSAAEVALMQLVHNGEVANCISQPVVMALSFPLPCSSIFCFQHVIYVMLFSIFRVEASEIYHEKLLCL